MRTKEQKTGKSTHYITTAFILITLWQGGFTDTAWCLAGVFFSAILLFKFNKFPPKNASFLLLGAVIFYIVSVVLNGSHAEGWMGVLKIIVVVLWLLVLLNIRTDTEQLAFWSGLLVAVTGILAFLGVLPIPGAATAGRLFGIFQYANATGIFLAVCAFLTRYNNKRRHWALVMEAALLLTQSAGSILVYLIGLGYIWITKSKEKNKQNKIIRTLIPVSLLLIPISLFLIRGLRPFYTFLERAVHITDGFRVMLRHPFGIGPGAWSLYVREFQSASYSAVLPHCGYIQIGLDGGFLALGCVFALTGYWLYKHKANKYTAAALMILVHAAIDISFSFLAVTMLLLLCVKSSLPERETTAAKKWTRALFAVPIFACLMLFVPETVKNQAGWAARDGDFKAAAQKLENGFLLPNDTHAQLRLLSYAVQGGDFKGAEAAFESIKNPNAEALRWQALCFMEQNEYEKAAEAAMKSVEKSPRFNSSYRLLDEIMPRLDDALSEEYKEQSERIREKTKNSAHVFAKYIE